ncbi:MAG: hypothetical protein OXI53_10465 [Nitrospira sp.]|nr:hypothetical protein [Nitrospira sp.]MDE0405723.1 hypothetical protein [Nitrospira sp.]MDE0485595.1 hypothetical protein [Nitrospira sp.]
MAKRTPLVCQYLEKISRSALEKYQGTIREYVAKRHGVYALYRGNRLYYVSLASNLRNRLRHHLRDRHGQSWDRFSVYLTIGDSHIKELESLVLRIVSPPGNKLVGTFGKAENLRNQLGQAIRQQQRIEYEDLIGGRKRKTPVKPRVTSPKNRKGQLPVLSKYISNISPPLKLKAKFKNKTVTARVAKNGTIRFAGNTYFSPSLAAKAVCNRSCNGWTFWNYERAPGDWVRLNQLRK